MFKFKYVKRNELKLHPNIVELKITLEFKGSEWFFSVEIIIFGEESYFNLNWNFISDNTYRRYYETAHCHCLVHVKVHRFVVAKCVKSANGSESEPSSRFIANVIEILKRHFAYIQILPCSVSPLTISLSLSWRNKLINGKIDRWISKIPCLPNVDKRNESRADSITKRFETLKKKRENRRFSNFHNTRWHSSINLSPQ